MIDPINSARAVWPNIANDVRVIETVCGQVVFNGARIDVNIERDGLCLGYSPENNLLVFRDPARDPKHTMIYGSTISKN